MAILPKTKTTIDSKEFQEGVINLYYEGLEVSHELQEKAIAIINSGKELSPQLIKETLDIE